MGMKRRFDPRRHHRRSIRLVGYDYGSAGAYFVTLCTHQRELLFEDPVLRRVAETLCQRIPGHFPHVRLDEWVVMPNHLHGILVITDDHRRGEASPETDSGAEAVPAGEIGSVSKGEASPATGSGAEPVAAGEIGFVSKGEASLATGSGAEPVPASEIGSVSEMASSKGEASPATGSGAEPVAASEIGFVGQGAAGDASPLRWRAGGVAAGSLGAIVGNFKSVTARRINRLRHTPGAPVWQRNYYEHIVRDERALNAIRQYIADNPARWAWDTYNPAALGPDSHAADLWRLLQEGADG